MSIRTDFRTYLLTKSTVTDLVGTGDNARVYPGFAPQGVSLPHVVLNTISDVSDHDMDGANGWTEARVQVDCYARTVDDAEALAEVIRLACDGYKGTMGAAEVAFCFQEAGDDGPEPYPTNEPRQRSRRRDDYRFAYFKALPTL